MHRIQGEQTLMWIDLPLDPIKGYDFIATEFNCDDIDRFLDNGDGTVTDCHTGLIWLENADCFGN